MFTDKELEVDASLIRLKLMIQNLAARKAPHSWVTGQSVFCDFFNVQKVNLFDDLVEEIPGEPAALWREIKISDTC